MSSDNLNGTGTAELNGKPATEKPARKPAARSFLSELYGLRDEGQPESTLIRATGPDGLTYTVRVPSADGSLDAGDIAAAAKEHTGRVRVSDPSGDASKSKSWGIAGDNAARTVRKLLG